MLHGSVSNMLWLDKRSQDVPTFLLPSAPPINHCSTKGSAFTDTAKLSAGVIAQVALSR